MPVCMRVLPLAARALAAGLVVRMVPPMSVVVFMVVVAIVIVFVMLVMMFHLSATQYAA